MNSVSTVTTSNWAKRRHAAASSVVVVIIGIVVPIAQRKGLVANSIRDASSSVNALKACVFQRHAGFVPEWRRSHRRNRSAVRARSANRARLNEGIEAGRPATRQSVPERMNAPSEDHPRPGCRGRQDARRLCPVRRCLPGIRRCYRTMMKSSEVRSRCLSSFAIRTLSLMPVPSASKNSFPVSAL